MTRSTSAGSDRIVLRALLEADFTERYLGWFRDPEVTRFLDARDITHADALDHLEAGKAGNRWFLYAICLGEDARHIGNLKIGPIHWRHRVSDLVTVIGDRDAWGKGYAKEAIRAGIRIAFEELNLRKLSASIDSLNVRSIRAYQAAGFEMEAALPCQFLSISDGKAVLSDKIFVAAFNSEFDASRIKE